MNCEVCNSKIGEQELQQPIVKYGKTHSAHYDCGLIWNMDEMDVFKITYDGISFYTDNLKELEGFEYYDEYKVTRVPMLKSQFFNLPEFQGF